MKEKPVNVYKLTHYKSIITQRRHITGAEMSILIYTTSPYKAMMMTVYSIAYSCSCGVEHQKNGDSHGK